MKRWSRAIGVRQALDAPLFPSASWVHSRNLNRCLISFSWHFVPAEAILIRLRKKPRRTRCSNLNSLSMAMGARGYHAGQRPTESRQLPDHYGEWAQAHTALCGVDCWDSIAELIKRSNGDIAGSGFAMR